MSGMTPTISRSTKVSSSRLIGWRMIRPSASSGVQPKRRAADSFRIATPFVTGLFFGWHFDASLAHTERPSCQEFNVVVNQTIGSRL